MSYRVRFVNYPEQYRRLKPELDAAIQRVLENGDFILRQDMREFEERIAARLGVKHAIGLNSGTDALYLSLLALGIGRGDEVITVAHTFLATVGAIVNCGATPVLVDVGDDHNMDVDLAAQAVTPHTKAIIPVHLNGRMCDMSKVMALAESCGLAVIEDAAQALGATFQGRPAGSFGSTACFSFYPAKILGTPGDGGMVVTSDDSLARQLRGLRDNGRVNWQDQVIGYGFNSRLDNLHAAILNVKLGHLEEFLIRRRELARMYDEKLSGMSGLHLPPPPSDDSPYYDVYQNYVVQTPRRDDLVAHLKANGIETLISWAIPMHHQQALGLSHFHLPQTEAISREVLSLPMYPEMSDNDAEYVTRAVSAFFR
jgi:dTDP-3-amino-2,3,6-trideoxy-4-keto-D-glucose/dTDP-3-amino-3,4,6-trideoxy-alpha-D-glucose/dTDP-2,6-dideoxy-D-kanosamine transaminase